MESSLKSLSAKKLLSQQTPMNTTALLYSVLSANTAEVNVNPVQQVAVPEERKNKSYERQKRQDASRHYQKRYQAEESSRKRAAQPQTGGQQLKLGKRGN